MANTVKIKQSAVPAKIPTTAQLALGELAINTYDGKLYTKRDDGTEVVVEIGGSKFTVGATAPTAPAEGDRWLDSDDGVEYVWVGGSWVDVTLSQIADALVPTTVSSGDTWHLPADTQAVFAVPIELGMGATLDLDGHLVQVGQELFASTNTSSSTVEPEPNQNLIEFTALATDLTFSNMSTYPPNGHQMRVRIRTTGSARTLTFGSEYIGVGGALPTTTPGANKWMYFDMCFNTTDNVYHVLLPAYVES